MNFDNVELKQRGRASVDFAALLAAAAGSVIQKVGEDLDSIGIDADKLPADLDERANFMDESLSGSHAYATQRLLGDWHGRNHGRIAKEAFEEVAGDLAPMMEANESGTATLELDPEFQTPAYWEGVDFHRTEGGWDAHEHMGYIHSEIIHKKMVARFFPGGIFQQRKDIAAKAPRDDYKRILDMGCSSGHFTVALQNIYPDAEITGVDLSPRMLEHAHRIANDNDWNWKLYQRAAEDTGFDDNSFDLVASYILLHEIPEETVRAVFKEAFRVAASGGDMLMSDVTRYADLDKLSVWKADNGARYGGEPHWRASASLDLVQIAEEAGFVDVKAEGIYPHYVMGRKPEA